MGRQRGRTGELGDALGHPDTCRARDHAVVQCDVPCRARGGHIACGSGDHVARKLLVRCHPLSVGLRESVDDDVEPRLEFVVAAGPDLDSRRSDPVQRVVCVF
jgi:hypothetical protein